MKHSSSSQFADDTCLLYAQNKIKSVETNLKCLWSIQVNFALWRNYSSSRNQFADDTCLLYAQNKIEITRN